MLQYQRRRFFKLITDYTWLRSGYSAYAYIANYMTSLGYWLNTYNALRLAVRPALYKKYALSYNAFGGGFLNYLAAFRC